MVKCDTKFSLLQCYYELSKIHTAGNLMPVIMIQSVQRDSVQKGAQ